MRTVLAVLALLLFFALLPIVLAAYGAWWNRWMGPGAFLELLMPRVG
jgi:hypothetical protein